MASGMCILLITLDLTISHARVMLTKGSHRLYQSNVASQTFVLLVVACVSISPDVDPDNIGLLHPDKSHRNISMPHKHYVVVTYNVCRAACDDIYDTRECQ